MLFESGHNLGHVRSLFLRVLSLCYAIAFLSLYTQVRGLYGDRGVLPVPHTFEPFQGSIQDVSILWIGSFLGIAGYESMEVVCLLGTLLGILATVCQSLANKLTFFLMLFSYYSLFNVGQTFLWFQWDILLLETGFVALLVSPTSGDSRPRPRDHVSMMLVRWLLFRMMFSSGVVKLQSGCPHWWRLTAMPLHYESQCIPTYLSWFAHNLNSSTLHKLSVVFTFVTEIPLALFFFAPTKWLRQMSLFFQAQLMVAIMLTGNYNFFNLLYLGLCVSLLDDADIEPVKDRDDSVGNSSCFRTVSRLVNLMAVVGLTAATFWTFSGLTVNLTEPQFDSLVTTSTKIGLGLGFVCLVHSFLIGLVKTFSPSDSRSRLLNCTVIRNLFSLLLHSFFVGIIFLLSLPVFLNGIQQKALLKQVPLVPGHEQLRGSSLINSYGLFRRMTGTGGRPEIVIEGSAASGPWKEFHFRYKPGNVSDPLLPFVLPHQPRLDWQMWFAALGSYEDNPWLISLVYRLLQGEESVRSLLDNERSPFKDEPPRYVRIVRYKYHFTTDAGVSGTNDWWWRDDMREYLQPVALGESGLEEYLESTGILRAESPANTSNPPPWMSKSLTAIRNVVKTFPDHLVVQSVAVSTFLAATMF